MRSFTHIETDVECGWEDEVGSSLISVAKAAGASQEQACTALMAELERAESAIRNAPSYQSNAETIRSCRVE
jgi:hypothetical protein